MQKTQDDRDPGNSVFQADCVVPAIGIDRFWLIVWIGQSFIPKVSIVSPSPESQHSGHIHPRKQPEPTVENALPKRQLCFISHQMNRNRVWLFDGCSNDRKAAQD